MLNLDAKGTLRVYGIEKPNIEAYVKSEALSSVLASNREYGTDLKPGDELPSIVVIRADKATPFKLLNRLIKACQDNGFRNFALKALNKAEGT